MALTLNGDDGVAGVNGSATTPAIQGTDTNTGLTFGTDTVNVVTGGSTRATVDSNGRLGVGTTSPATTLDIEASADAYVTLQPGTADGNAGLLINNSAGTQKGVILYDTDDNYMLLSTENTERVRIGSNGTTFFGTNLGTNLASTEPVKIGGNCGDRGGLLTMRDDGIAGTNRDFIRFHDSSSNDIGAIEHNGSSSVAYLTSSDYRLKENIIPLANAVDRIKQLPVRRFNFISDPNRTVDGFLAHEAQAVVPEAISGEKDAVDDNGNPVYQGIDQSKLVPLLTAALQEAISKIEALETRVAQLEGGAS